MSAFGPKPTSASELDVSVFKGKAEVTFPGANALFPVGVSIQPDGKLSV